MARSTSSIGIFNDLGVGTGNYVHSDLRWVGGTGNGADTLDNRQYEIGDMVVYPETGQRQLYVCTQQNVDRLPTNTTYWAVVSDPAAMQTIAASIAPWSPSASYQRNDAVTFTASGLTNLYGAEEAIAPGTGIASPAVAEQGTITVDPAAMVDSGGGNQAGIHETITLTPSGTTGVHTVPVETLSTTRGVLVSSHVDIHVPLSNFQDPSITGGMVRTLAVNFSVNGAAEARRIRILRQADFFPAPSLTTRDDVIAYLDDLSAVAFEDTFLDYFPSPLNSTDIVMRIDIPQPDPPRKRHSRQ